VPEPKQSKNRLHLDLVPLDRRREDEVDRLVGIGARVVADRRRPDGTGWVVLADPEGNEFCIEGSDAERVPLVEQLGQALAAVSDLIADVRADQWSEPTPCTDWTVRRLVEHLIGMNKVFAALLAEQPPPPRDVRGFGDDPVGAYQASAAALLAAFGRPGILERIYQGPLGAATGEQRLQIRLYDLLAHAWDLGHAIGQPVELPDEFAERSLAFVRTQVSEDARPGRFAAAQPIAEDAPALDRLAAFLGRQVSAR
jgi:uncharacterized protein (TIGR03086 family)